MHWLNLYLLHFTNTNHICQYFTAKRLYLAVFATALCPDMSCREIVVNVTDKYQGVICNQPLLKMYQLFAFCVFSHAFLSSADVFDQCFGTMWKTVFKGYQMILVGVSSVCDVSSPTIYSEVEKQI